MSKCNPKKPPANGSDKVYKPYFCATMWEHISVDWEPYDKPFRLFVLTKFTNVAERNLAGVLAIRRTKKQRDVLLNFCPFCGVKYAAWLKPHLEKAP